MPEQQAFEHGSRQRVLLVIDDDTAALHEISDYMEMFGHRVVCATSGSAAVEIAAREQPDLILCDINMPGWDGIRVANVLQTLDHQAVLLLISGDVDAVRRANEHGVRAVAVLTKPMSLPVFRRYVEALE